MNGLTRAQEAFLAHFEGVKREGNGFRAPCPGHYDYSPSLSIRFVDGKALVHDFGGCGTEYLLERAGLKPSDLFFDVPTNGDRSLAHRITVDALARDKKLPLEFLRSLGLKDIPKGVAIPYYLQDGSLAPRQRTRTALSAGSGSCWNNGKDPLVPYGLQKLHEARDKEFLVMAEGESDSWTCWFHGLPCLGIPGATTAKCLQTEHLVGIKKIFILQEPDRGGSAFVSGLAKRFAEIGYEGEARIVSLSPYKDPNALHQSNPDIFLRNFLTFLNAATPLRADEQAPPDVSTPESIEWPEPLKAEGFHGLAGEFVRTVAPQSEADPTALLVQFLAAVGNAMGHSPYFEVEQQPHHANLFVLIVGNTSKSRKGSSFSRVKSLVSAVESEWVEHRIHGGVGSGEGVIHAVRDDVLKNGKLEDEGVQDKRLLPMEPEFAQVLAIIERQGTTLSEILRRAWDCTTLQNLTKNSPARASGAHISVVGHITKPELLRHLSDTELANGFANRFIFCCVKRANILPNGGQLDWHKHPGIIEKLAAAIQFARSTSEMKRDSAAESLWAEKYAALSNGRPGLLGSVISRAEAQVLRLSMLYALLDCSGEIRREHLQEAMAVWRYAENSCRYIFGDSTGDPMADEILRMLRANPDGLTRWDITLHFGRNRSEAQIGGALRLLEENGLATCRRGETGGRGRPAERWFAVSGSTK